MDLSAGETETVNFGDTPDPEPGTIKGWVFVDDDADGLRDKGDQGLPSVAISLSNGDYTTTSATGAFSFEVSSGTYTLVESEPQGYASTTPNSYTGLIVEAGDVVVRSFGEIVDEAANLDQVQIAVAGDLLSVVAMDAGEDAMGDLDIVVGQARDGGGGQSLLIYHNQWQGPSTGVTDLFESTPTLDRDAGNDVSAVSTHDFTLDGHTDIVAGLDYSSGNNVQLWYGSAGGNLSPSADAIHASSVSTTVRTSEVADFNNDGRKDLVLGLENSFGTWSGSFETFQGGADGTIQAWSNVSRAGASATLELGHVVAIVPADLDGDGDLDLVIGSRTGDWSGFVDLYANNGYATGFFVWAARYRTTGKVNDIAVIDMVEDDNRDLDIVAAVSTQSLKGELLLWTQDSESGVWGKADAVNFTFGPEETPRWPSASLQLDAEPTRLATMSVDRDIFPDIIVGLKSSDFNDGGLLLLQTNGTLPPDPTLLSAPGSGEVLDIDTGDFNRDGKIDILVGSQTTSGGRIEIYFNQLYGF